MRVEIDLGQLPKVIHRRPTIGVLVGWQVYSGSFDSFLDRVYHGILAAAAERDCNLMLACGTGLPYGVSFGRPAWPYMASQVDFVPVGPWNCDGLIVLPPIGIPGQAEFVADLVQKHYPVVCSVEIAEGTTVTADNRSGINQAIDHLISHGHRRIAFIAGRGDVDGDSRIRLQAYHEGMRRHGIVYDPNLVVIGYHNNLGGRQAMQELLKRKVKFSAMICSNDESAVGAMHVLQAAGYLVPQDVAVIGFDDRIDARAHIPMLTSVHYPMFDVGYQTVQTLLKVIDGSLTEHQQIMIPTRLVVRESCGCLGGMTSEYIPAGYPIPSLQADLHFDHGAPHGTSSPKQKAFDSLTQAIITAVSSEEYHLGLNEVDHLSHRLVEALQSSLEMGNPSIFSQTFQQILTRISAQNDDLFTWHKVTTLMRAWLPALLQEGRSAGTASPAPLNRQTADDMLIQARAMISESSQGQTARQTVWLENISNQLGEMSATFFTAQSENEIYGELIRRLPSMGIFHTAVAFYSRSEGDEYTWSELQAASGGLDTCRRRFPTRHFPPEGLFAPDRPFSVAILPMTIAGVNSGFVVFDTGNLPVCATIVQQLTASLRGIHLYSQAVEARQIAETGKRMAEDANRLKNRFLSWVIHELRTPLNLIYGLSDMLLHENTQPQSGKLAVEREDIERIHIGSEHLINLIRDVLDLASSEIGQLKLVRETLDLNAELRATAAIGSQLARAKNLKLRSEIDDGLPAVFADRTRIRQIILNLINNSVKFTNQGEIILRANAVGGVVMITIQDSGLGIPAGEQSRIFEEFQQSERTSARGFGGLGLGLAICKRLVEMHEGEIGVQSSGVEGKGSTFYFTLPALGSPPETLVSEPQDLSSPKLLLLVNDIQDGKQLKRQLDQRGYETQVYLVRAENDWLAKVLLEHPQAIVLDLGLASLLGWEILKILKENPATQDLPVMFCSLEEAGDSGAMLELDYITKPLGSAELSRILLSRGFAESGNPAEAGKTILIVDDELETLNLHARMIQTQVPKSQIIQAHNGHEALEIIHQRCPDLILLDLIMPEIDGFTVLETMQQDEQTRNIPVIVLTGQALTAEDMERLNCGVTSVLGKGMYNVQETMKHITDALTMGRRRAGSETQRVVLKAMAYLHTNYSAPITRKDVADHVGLSERHLTRCFNQELGLTPMTYLNRYRVKQAKELLETGRKSIADIAEIVGFSSGGYFTRVFRDEVGVSPRDFLRGKNTPS